MPNKFGRSVPVSPFNPQGAIADGLPDVARPSGAPFEAAAGAAESVAATIGKLADKAAVVEGKQAGLVAGADDNYRPTGSITLRGQAFDEAATKVYAQNLDARMLTSLQAVYDQNKDSPARLNGALDALHRTMSAQDVFPEVAGAFNAAFAKQANAYRKSAEAHAEAKARDNLVAQTISNLSAVSTTVRQQTATLDPNAPETEAAIADGLARADGIYKNAAAHGAVSQATVARNTIAMRNDAYGELVLRRAGALRTPEQVADFRDRFNKDFAAGKYNGKLDGDGFDKTQADLTRLETGMATAARANEGVVKKGFDDYVQREAAGLKPSDDEWTALTAAAKDLPDGDGIVALAQAKRQVAARIAASSILQGDAILQKLRDDARATGGSSAQAELIAFAQKQLDAERKGLNSDQLGTAQAKGLIAGVAPLDFEGFAQSDKPADVDAFAGQLRARVAQADAVGQGFSRDPQYLRPEEKARMAEIAAQGGDRALAMVAAINKGGGERAPAILHEIAPDMPQLAQIGAVLLDGGSLPAMRDAMTAAHLKKTQGLKLDGLPGTQEQTTAGTVLGQAYLWSPGANTRVRAVAEQIAQVRLQREGLSPKDNSTRTAEIYERALKEATGAVFVGDAQYGGVAQYSPPQWIFGSAKVVTPPGLRADKFSTAISAITDKDLAATGNPPVAPDGKPYHARDLQDAIPVRAGNGYAFVRSNYLSGGDNQFILGKSGKPYVLDWADIEPVLRQRRPDLFLGGAR